MKYMLNPAYLLRQDGNRVILFYRDDIGSNGEEWFTFIHPFQACMLSFFKGKESFDKELEKCSQFFQIPFEKMRGIISPFINNPKWFAISQRDGHSICFPKNMLIEKKKGIQRQLYSVEDFSYIGQPDYHTHRLHYPVGINMELNMKCRTDCVYCYANKQAYKNDYLNTQVILNFIREAKRGGVLKMDINGGEVLLHPGIKEILRTLLECDYNPLVSTKIPINPEMANYIKSLGIHRIQLSLDSVDPVVLKAMLGVDMSYIKEIEATLNYLNRIHLRTDINVVLTKMNSNVTDFKALISFLSRYEVVKLVRVSPCGYSLYKKGYNILSPTIKEIETIVSCAEDLKNDYPNLTIKISAYETSDMYTLSYRKENFHKRAMCTGNVRNAVVLPNGDVTICEELYDHPNFIIGNIKNKSLDEIWNSEKAIKLYHFAFDKSSESICYKCGNRQKCRVGKGVCWKTILMAYGMDKWDYPDPRCPLAPDFKNIFYHT